MRKRLRNNIDSRFSRTGHFPVGQDGVHVCVCVCVCEKVEHSEILGEGKAVLWNL